ncbi:MAG: STAS domain-containing protein [Candidatus Acidiferrales bacterium]
MSANPADVSAHRLKLHTFTVEDATVVQCTGRLTAEHTSMLKTEVKAMIPQTKRIVLDLTDLNHMDSAGLGTIVGLYVSAKRVGCDFRLINLNKRVRELLGITNLLSVFEACGQYRIKMP